MLVTPDKKLYLHKEAYVRTSSTPYNLDDLSNRCVSALGLQFNKSMFRLSAEQGT